VKTDGFMGRKTTVRLVVILSGLFIASDRERQSAEIAIVADLSGSTNGLLDDLRDNLWNFVNYFKRSNPETELRLAFVGFSRGSFGLENGYVRIFSDLTTVYDDLAMHMFHLVGSVEKGDQYVGAALRVTIHRLSWSKDRATRRIILLFGNSRADLGPVNYQEMIQAAIKRGIIIHSIYCIRPNTDPRILEKWHAIADNTGGQLFQYRVTRRSPNKNISSGTKRLIDINHLYNETFISFNPTSRAAINKMIAADDYSLRMSERFFVSRCYFKISEQYQAYLKKNDLAYRLVQKKEWPSINRHFLPEDLKNASTEELKVIAEVRYERRQKLLERMRQILAPIEFEHIAVNPIDSVFAEALSRHF
jgi:hypothetical protein